MRFMAFIIYIRVSSKNFVQFNSDYNHLRLLIYLFTVCSKLMSDRIVGMRVLYRHHHSEMAK